MKKVVILLSMLHLFMVLTIPSLAKASELAGVSNPQRAQYNWVMRCQGCHGADASGSKGGAPNMVGVVAQFLHSEEGRNYLGRVPGVAFADLSEQEVAELLNWLTQTFDENHMPKKFKPYNGEELKRLRNDPLISQVFFVRKNILQSLNN